MKIKHAVHNGNVEAVNRFNITNVNRHTENRNWSTRNSYDITNNYTETLQCINTTNFVDYNNQTETLLDNRGDQIVETQRISQRTNKNPELVCNRQYRLDTKFNTNFENSRNKTETVNLEGATESYITSCDTFQGSNNVSVQSTPVDEERAFDTDTDEMSDKGMLPVPRGIVNPNYPGFQHLAHTLQDYSTNIENFYHSENEMTDDDVDIEISDATLDLDSKSNEMNTELSIGNNNNNDFTETILNNLEKKETIEIICNKKCVTQSNIPDLLKTVSKNNNADSFSFELNCSDIENNFNTRDIIGDFNKEIEDEIKQVLNYNINIQDDLEELKKDIKNNLATPIENTINNISEVVNHVIKKLVVTHCDINESDLSKQNAPVGFDDEPLKLEITEEENATNALKEMTLSRPTFLLLENNINHKISDAFLSDGKEEIKICDEEFDPEKLTNSVESTIKQLSTELRKIIPKLDELREREKLFAVNKTEPLPVLTDGNCNQIASSSSYNTCNVKSEKPRRDLISKSEKENLGESTVKKFGFRNRNNQRIPRDRQSDVRTSGGARSAHNSSVHNKEECDLGSFDVYNIETALPKLDIDAIESHLKAAKEAERRKRNDREEIRRRLAMGTETDEYYSLGHVDRPGKKPSLQSRLQSGRNLQICFMNETASDNESQASDVEKNIPTFTNKNLSKMSIFSKSNYSLNNHPYQTRPLSVNISKNDKISTTVVQSGAKLRPSSLSLKTTKSRSSHSLGHIELRESDFFVLQATLQTEARIALAQAKEMARVQMERERRGRAVSPVTEMLRRSMEKANAPLAADRRRVSRHLLTDMNIAQLQVIVNELHSQIESLNESLVKLLMARDELHMGQDSMLVDIEDLTRYLGVKEQTKKTKGPSKSGVRRLTSFVHK